MLTQSYYYIPIWQKTFEVHIKPPSVRCAKYQYSYLPMQKICCTLGTGFMRWWLPFTHNRQPCNQSIGITTIMLYQCIQPVNCCVFFNGEKCIFPMPSYLIMYHFTLCIKTNITIKTFLFFIICLFDSCLDTKLCPSRKTESNFFYGIYNIYCHHNLIKNKQNAAV